MIRYYVNNCDEKGLLEVDTLQKDCWVYMELPTMNEIAMIASATGIPEQFMKSALDEEEVAHLDDESNAKLVVIDIPKMAMRDDESEIFTIPLALIHNDNYFVTVCTKQTWVLNEIIHGKTKNVNVTKKVKLTYQIMYNSSTRFLHYLKQIDKASDRLQKDLSKSMQNKELLQLLNIQKSLVFFSASLTANYAIIQKMANNVKKCSDHSKEELDILDDVIVENKQALEMCSVYREIIKSTMDAFASVVNNNQNMVMKLLTAITIILSIPMLIASLWGMNTGVPFGGKNWGFWAVTAISILISAAVTIIMSKKKML